MGNSSLTTLVNNSKANYLYLGAFSENEYSTDTWANLDLTLSISYTASVSIVADNNFTISGGNHGSIKVDNSSYTAPYTFSRNTGTNVSLQAISPQTDNQGYQEIWNTSSCYTSKWTRDGNLLSTNQTYSFSVTSTDNGKTYLANFLKNHVTTSGNLPTDETWLSSVTLTGNVIVP